MKAKQIVVAVLVTLSLASLSAIAGEWLVTKDTRVKVFNFDLYGPGVFCSVREGGVLYTSSHVAEHLLKYSPPKGKRLADECGPEHPYLAIDREEREHFAARKK